MSRIGKNPIKIENGVTVELKGNLIVVKGPKGELTQEIHPRVNVAVEENQVVVTRNSDDKFDRSLHGLHRSLIANMCEGVTKGFNKELEIQGVGYRAQVQGKTLKLNLGYSHPIEYKVPEGITVEMEKDRKNIIKVSGIDKQLVGQVAANIRSYRKPEPYKGKGIRYVGEYVAMKAGKTAAK